MSCGFTSTDLTNIINIIEVCSKRGAFHAEELSGVGQLYNKLKKSLDYQSQLKVENVSEGIENSLEVRDGEKCDSGECDGGVCPISNCGT